MKGLVCFLFAFVFVSIAHSQQKSVYIVKKQEGSSVTLMARNTSKQSLLLTLEVKSKGMNIPSPKVVKKQVAGMDSVDMITLQPMPGQAATYSYHLEAAPLEDGMITTEIYRKREVARNLIGNSARLRPEQARNNVEKNIKADKLYVFIENDSERCDDVINALDSADIKYQPLNISENKDYHQLMWDAMYVYGEKEGRILMPVIIVNDKIYHSIENLEEWIQTLTH